MTATPAFSSPTYSPYRRGKYVDVRTRASTYNVEVQPGWFRTASATTGMSQTRYCGESTLPNATYVDTAIADAISRRFRVAAPRAYHAHTATSSAPRTMV